ncbi:cyclin [Fomitopsis serialis]|uniref:cyclin n=1 Tax=Fomitopsis serialis TaxID=139415 RepID=UPI002007CAB6|nr:cyclin [Neoantrodia serialis]KAH9937605.1 cyclin [Neoantrodia serialis]
MKDVLPSSSRASRHSAYLKKRPSPHGVSKSRKQSSPVYIPLGAVRKTPRAVKAELISQRQRQMQLLLMRRDGIYLEEEYREEIRRYMHEMENCTAVSMQSMDQQPEIRWHMRPCLVDFLVEIHFTFRLRPETLYLTLNIIDRYVSRRIVYVKHYQLVGCAALWIAAKFEDAKERVPTVSDLAHICQDTYDESAFIQMEQHVLSTIQWTLGHPTAEAWLRLMCCTPCLEDAKIQHVARFLMEITLFHREFCEFSPSSIALGSLTLARFLSGKPRRFFEETEECLQVVDLLDQRLSQHVEDLSKILVKKYSYAFFSKASTSVVQYYLEGKRFHRQPLAPLPMTPVRHYSSKASTPMSVSTTASDLSDDMPVTPTSPTFSSDVFSSSMLSDAMMSDDKENVPSPTFEPVLNKQYVEPAPEQFLPQDYLKFGRQALHSLNLVSPRTAAVS